MPNAVHHLPSLSFNSDEVATLRNRYIEKIIMDHHSCSFQCWARPCRRSPRYEEEEGCRVASAVCKRNRQTRAHFEKWMKNSVVKVQ